MKLKLAVFCLFIAMGIVDVHAAMPPNFERAEASLCVPLERRASGKP